MRARLTLALLAAVLLAFAPAPFHRKDDLTKLAGTWTVVRYECGRNPVRSGTDTVLKVTVDKKRWSFFTQGPAGKIPSSEYDLTLDTNKTPGWIDLVAVQNKAKLQGIFRWRNGEFHIAFHTYNVPERPTEFAGQNNRVYYLTLRRDR
jgi:uncharacterized protein (TIGR03067 family)